jgi:hypothetical protein
VYTYKDTYLVLETEAIFYKLFLNLSFEGQQDIDKILSKIYKNRFVSVANVIESQVQLEYDHDNGQNCCKCAYLPNINAEDATIL